MSRIGIVAEAPREKRVAATPTTVPKLLALGYDVVVEAGAGAASSFPDAEYAASGAAVVSAAEAWASEIVLKVDAPTPEEIARLADGATLIALLSPALRPDLVESLATRGITALALDAVPRISRAQSMDVLSSMANISGYPPEAWLYIGGPVSVIYIFMSATLVAHTGVLLLGLGAVVGQLGMSFALDALWPAPASPGLVQEIAMVLVALLSVVVATVPWRRLRR